jgi:hypothetical protein
MQGPCGEAVGSALPEISTLFRYSGVCSPRDLRLPSVIQHCGGTFRNRVPTYV